MKPFSPSHIKVHLLRSHTHTHTHVPLKIMPSHVHSLLFLFLFLLLPLAATAHKCSQEFKDETQTYTYKNSTPITLQNCRKKTLGAEFAWSFDKTSRLLHVAFGAKLRHPTGCLAWGLNPLGPHMVDTRALVGIKHRNESLGCRRYIVTAATKLKSCPLLPSDHLDARLDGLFAEYGMEYSERLQYYVIRATLVLPPELNSSRAYVVWQVGEDVIENEVLMHPKTLHNFDSAETLDLETGAIVSYTRHQRYYMRLAHGILNIVGWGTLLPSGAITARYTRMYPMPCPRWYDVHVTFQSIGYITGSAGWALGLWLGKTSRNYKFNIHHNLGLLIFIFTSIQMLAWRLRPALDDGYRTYWNMYHHFLGYSILVLISFNIFLGIKILEPEHVWKWAYIGVLGGLGAVALSFEVYAWIRFLILDRNYPKQG